MTKVTGGDKPFAKLDHNKAVWRPSRKAGATLGGRIEIVWRLAHDAEAVTAETVTPPCTVRHATAIAAIKRMIAARFVAVGPHKVLILSTKRISEIRDWRIWGLRRENGTGRSVRFDLVVRCDMPVGFGYEETRSRLTRRAEALTLSEIRNLCWEPAVTPQPQPVTTVTKTVEPSSPTLLAERFGQALIAAKGGVL